MRNRQKIEALEGFSCRIGHNHHPEAALHHHDRPELGWCHEGHGTLLVDGRIERYAAPCAALIAAGSRHFHHSAPGAESRWTFLFPDPTRLLAPGVTALAVAATKKLAHVVLTPSEHPALCGPMRLLAEAWETRRLDEAWLGGQMQSLLAAWRTLPGAAKAVGHNAIEPAMRLLAERGGAVQVADLSHACGLAASSLRQAFVRAHGVPPKRFLDRYRLDMAAAALLANPGRRILAVALDCGFASQSAFNRAFHKEFKVSPRSWRSRTIQ